MPRPLAKFHQNRRNSFWEKLGQDTEGHSFIIIRIHYRHLCIVTFCQLHFSWPTNKMLLLILNIIFALTLSNCNAACTLSERGRSIMNMRIMRTNPGMYYAVDRVRRPYDKNGCPRVGCSLGSKIWNKDSCFRYFYSKTNTFCDFSRQNIAIIFKWVAWLAFTQNSFL